MRLAGPLGLAWWPRRIATDLAVTVVPEIIGRSAAAAERRALGPEPARRPGAGAEVLQLRDYRRGDPLRAIDWKASARSSRLISRDFSEDQHLQIVLVVDTGRASGLGAGEVDRLSLYVNVAARLAQRAVSLGDAVGVLSFAAQPLAALAPASGASAVARMSALLAACRVQPSESNPILAAGRVLSLTRRRSLVVLFTDLEDAAAGEPLLQAVQLLSPKHLACVAGLRSERISALAQTAVAEPLGAYRALAAVEYTHTLSRHVRALNAVGAAALIARPEHLDQAVFAAYREFRRRRRI